MCIVYLKFDPTCVTPIQIGANREENPNRPHTSPIKMISGATTCYIAGADKGPDGKSGHIGTWLGFNERGVAIAVTNRDDGLLKGSEIKDSRGLLCVRLLRHDNAKDAMLAAQQFLTTGSYGGSNFLIADLNQAFIVHAPSAKEVCIDELSPGLHVLTNLNINDPTDRRINFVHAYMHNVDWGNFDILSKELLNTPEILVVDSDCRTVSSSILRMGSDKVYHFWHSDRCPTSMLSYVFTTF